MSSRPPSRSRIGPTIGPAIPLPPSSTTFSGRIAAGSMNDSARRWNSPETSTSSTPPGAPSGARQPVGDERADVADPRVARQRERALAHELRARVRLRVVRGGAHQPAVELARADEEIEHLGPDHPGVEHVRALGHHAVAVARGELRRGQAHVAAEPDPQLARPACRAAREHARERAADLLGDVAVDLLAVEAADVVGLEDLLGKVVGMGGEDRTPDSARGPPLRLLRLQPGAHPDYAQAAHGAGPGARRAGDRPRLRRRERRADGRRRRRGARRRRRGRRRDPAGAGRPRDRAPRAVATCALSRSMHERKALMADLADGFVALPGGMGTLEELFEVYTWTQLGLHSKPLGLLDVRGYYAQLAAFLDHAVPERFLDRRAPRDARRRAARRGAARGVRALAARRRARSGSTARRHDRRPRASRLPRSRRRRRQPARRRPRRRAVPPAGARRSPPTRLLRDGLRRRPGERGTAHLHARVELPLAGHPLVGTAWLLAHTGTPVTVLRPPAGDVPVATELTWIRARAEWAPLYGATAAGAGRRRRARARAASDDRRLGVGGRGRRPDPRARVPERHRDRGGRGHGRAALQRASCTGRAIVIRQGAGSELHARPGGDGASRSAAAWRCGTERPSSGARARRSQPASAMGPCDTAVILCGGRGTRLQEHAQAIPKPLVEVGGRPIVWHVVPSSPRRASAACCSSPATSPTGRARSRREPSGPPGVRVECVDTGLDTPTGGRIHAVPTGSAARRSSPPTATASPTSTSARCRRAPRGGRRSRR